jgi:hypothetical protein
MSAGKGDTPRAVNGDRYRANYEAIFGLTNVNKRRKVTLVNSPYPAWICRPCGETHGRRTPEGHISTWHEDICGICGNVTEVSEPRDFGHIKKWPLTPKKFLRKRSHSCTNARNTPRPIEVKRHGN